ncbi:hypothetical protein J2Z45_002875 [Cohnella lubricantis]|nr:endonuclease/exonuclease/phosphatase family protein [Cohnella lubricantis]MBP2119282.1 hypothetical protein [Cohnella lubricantis]
MAYRKKASQILPYKPDILVVPECESPERLRFNSSLPKAKDMKWYGDNATKGLGIFSYSEFRFELHPRYNPDYKYIIPLLVTGPVEFTLFAVWAMNDRVNREHRYIGQVWNSLIYYGPEVNGNVVWLGDFNSNAIWDHERRIANHSDVVDVLLKYQIESAYHHFYREKHGRELLPTFYMHRKIDKPYHIDYCFLSSKLLHSASNFTVGKYSDWIAYSDHVPIIVDLKIEL